jgi:tetratricopeptide (TPR) repeat protein
MGSMLIELDEIDYATDCFLRAVNLDEENIDAFCSLAVTLAARDEYDGALQFYQHATELGCRNPQVLADIAFLYLKTGQLTLAIETINDAIDISGKTADAVKLKRKIQWSIFRRNLNTTLLRFGFYKVKLFFVRCRCRLGYMFSSVRR